MTDPGPDEVVVTWHGVYRRRAGAIVARWPAPTDPPDLAERLRTRLEGGRTSEEEAALAAIGTDPAVSADRRLGLPLSERGDRVDPPEPPEGAEAAHRTALLRAAEQALSEAWDPSIHVDEAVRTIGELDDTLNRIGERLVSWANRDGPPSDEEPTAARVARRLVAPGPSSLEVPSELPPADPALQAARADLARLYEQVAALRQSLDRAIEAAMPRRAPNLSALLGPLLAARMISLAGGLDRLARLPAGTIQVLGAEKAFFEHLRGRAPPPRHGALFIHPDVQGAPKRLRGRIARALAGKAAIAARLDAAGRPLRPELIEQFKQRSRRVTAPGPIRPAGGRKKGGAPTPST